MGITIKDVAKYANVSPATVSLVLNNREGVKESTKKNVLEAIENKIKLRMKRTVFCAIIFRSNHKKTTDISEAYCGKRKDDEGAFHLSKHHAGDEDGA